MHLVDALCEAKVALSTFEGCGYACSRSGITLGEVFLPMGGQRGHEYSASKKREVYGGSVEARTAV